MTLFNLIFFDFAHSKQLGFQDPATPIMEALINLYNTISLYLIVIFFFVFWLIIRVVYFFGGLYFQLEKLNVVFTNKDTKQLNFLVKYLNTNLKTLKYNHHHLLEIVWTIIPSILLVFIAIPSFSLLYCMDEVILCGITLKIVGHQWYWSYEYSDYLIENLMNYSMLLNYFNECNQNFERPYIYGDEYTDNLFDYLPGLYSDHFSLYFDSFMIPEEDLIEGQLRLLEVDNQVVVPIKHNIRGLVTSVDVLHSWCVPSLGIKIDAVPGRLNEVNFYIKRPGIYYGQCSEICGVNHGYMPIVIKAVEHLDYVMWASDALYVQFMECFIKSELLINWQN